MDRHAAKVLDFGRVLEALSGLSLTPQGKSACAEVTTASGFDEAVRLLDELEAFGMLTRAIGTPPIGEMALLDSILDDAAIPNACLDIERLMSVGVTIRTTTRVIEYLEDAGRENSPIAELADGHAPMYGMEERFAATFGPRGEVLDSASPELFRLRGEIRGLRSRVLGALKRILRDTEYEHVVRDDFITERSNRYVVPLATNFRGYLNGIVHDHSRTGQTVYVEPMEVVEINNKVNATKEAETAEVRRILMKLTADVGGEAHRIRAQVAIVAAVDMLWAKLKLSQRLECTKPTLSREPVLDVSSAKHPLLALRDDIDVVPVDLKLNGDERLILITGANAGGKTVALKTIGLLTIMAHSGLFLPAGEESVVGWFPQILADIGDEQDIDRDLSTFTAHMARLKEIFDTAGEGALVLIDEMGTGTDPSQGTALSVAVLEELAEMGVKVAATTHLDGLKAYAYAASGAVNAAVAFDPDSGNPLYSLLYGQAGSSNALDVAQRLGVPQRVLDRAKSLTGEKGDRVAKLVADLERARDEARVAAQQADHLSAELERDRSRQAELVAEAKNERRLAREEARKEALALIRDMRKGLSQAIKSVEKGEAREREASDKIDNVAEEVEKRFPKPQPEKPLGPLPELVEGVQVLVVPLGKRATVQSPPKSGRVRVAVGGLTTTVPVDALAPCDEQVEPPREHPKVGRVTVEAQRGSPDIKVIGMTVGEALEELDRSVNKALLGGFERFRVVHGRGTGALRRAIRERIEEDPGLNRHLEEEDDEAITWVELV